jgi:hypothetical protein
MSQFEVAVKPKKNLYHLVEAGICNANCENQTTKYCGWDYGEYRRGWRRHGGRRGRCSRKKLMEMARELKVI